MGSECGAEWLLEMRLLAMLQAPWTQKRLCLRHARLARPQSGSHVLLHAAACSLACLNGV